jgi:hypothetical protein
MKSDGIEVPALRGSRLIKRIAATPLRVWLLHVGPSGLFLRRQLHVMTVIHLVQFIEYPSSTKSSNRLTLLTTQRSHVSLKLTSSQAVPERLDTINEQDWYLVPITSK